MSPNEGCVQTSKVSYYLPRFERVAYESEINSIHSKIKFYINELEQHWCERFNPVEAKMQVLSQLNDILFLVKADFYSQFEYSHSLEPEYTTNDCETLEELETNIFLVRSTITSYVSHIYTIEHHYNGQAAAFKRVCYLLNTIYEMLVASFSQQCDDDVYNTLAEQANGIGTACEVKL